MNLILTLFPSRSPTSHPSKYGLSRAIIHLVFRFLAIFFILIPFTGSFNSCLALYLRRRQQTRKRHFCLGSLPLSSLKVFPTDYVRLGLEQGIEVILRAREDPRIHFDTCDTIWDANLSLALCASHCRDKPASLNSPQQPRSLSR